ncbi:hypothetical protein MKY91_03945 [Alkalicoccobacillus gibsonii]|uniref:Uncharacterized protein n=1 Tax=Alkalicoccobacillus gibsonii TaxID=79881 RepID=A0ABU9VEI2_9BACI
MRKKFKKNFNQKQDTKSFEKMAILISILALIISIFAFFTDSQTLRLAFSQDNERKTPVWVGKYNIENEEIVFESTNPEIILQMANIYFPSKFNLPKGYVSPGNHAYPTSILKTELIEYVREGYEVSEDSNQVAYEIIPVIITSNYVAQGNLFNHQAIYHIHYIATIPGDGSEPIIDIDGLTFDSHVDMKFDPSIKVDEHWDFLVDSDEFLAR